MIATTYGQLADTSLIDVDPICPVNRAHWSLCGCIAWYKGLPGLRGSKWYNLMRLGAADGFHGSFVNMDPAQWRPNDKCGGLALDFDGTDDHIPLDDVPFRLPSGTATAWVNADAFGSWEAVLGKDAGGTNDDLHFGMTKLRIENGGIVSVAFDSTPPTGTWYHIAAIWGFRGMHIWRDGVKQTATNSYTGGIVSAGNKLTIGALRHNGAYPCNARLDDLRVYNRPLWAPEIRWIYQNSLKGYPGVLNRCARRLGVCLAERQAAGPYRLVAGQVWHPGAAAGGSFVSGQRAGGLYHTGQVAGQIHG